LEKFYTRSDEGIFLGYCTKSKAYQCYKKRLNKIVESTNVRVDEKKKRNPKIKNMILMIKKTIQPKDKNIKTRIKLKALRKN
jgi:hypothetical protein